MKTMQEIETLDRSEMNRARSEGEVREGQSLILRQLNRRVGQMSIEIEEQVKALPLLQLEELGEALLDFTQMEDLIGWLNIDRG